MTQINNTNNILYQDSMPMFTTILDLRAYANYEQGDIVEVGGRTSIGDGYGSRFIYDSTSTAADDGEYTIRPDNIAANGSGRWLINGWAYLNDKMNADNKNLEGMTITSSTLDSSTITNSTLSNVTVPPTTSWASNTVVGAFDIDNRFETKGSVANDINTAVSASLATANAYTDTGLALKANLAGGNTFTGNQAISGALTITSANGTLTGNTTGSTKWNISRTDAQSCSIIKSYDGNTWHYLSIEDDGTIQCNNGTLALESAVDLKANLAGGNDFTGDQLVSGVIKATATDNTFTGLVKVVDSTTKGAIVRYNDGTTNYDWTLNGTSIVAPNGDIITTSGNYATKDTDNNFTVNQTLMGATLTSGTNIQFDNASGVSSLIYTDSTGNDGDLVIRTGPSSAYAYTTIEPDGSITSSIQGKVVYESDVPVGCLQYWPTETPPTGWLLLNGASFDKTQYPGLAAIYTSGILPDMRGKFVRVWDNGAGIDPNDGQTTPGTARALLTTQTDALQNMTGSVGNGYRGIVGVPSGVFNVNGQPTSIDWGGTGGIHNYDGFNFDASGSARTSTETRPTNMAWNAIVRAK